MHGSFWKELLQERLIEIEAKSSIITLLLDCSDCFFSGKILKY